MSNEHIVLIILLLFLFVVKPLLTPRIQKTDSEKFKYGKYLFVIALLWAQVLLVLTAMSPTQILYLEKPALGGVQAVVYPAAVLLYLSVTVFAPLLLLRSESFRKEFLQAYKKRTFIYPTARREQLLFLPVAVTVGIGEEVVFRSYMTFYVFSTLHLSLLYSFVISSIVFGIAHYDQGIKNLLPQTVTGLLLSLLYWSTGSLWLPMAVHIVLDAKIIWLSHYWIAEEQNKTPQSEVQLPGPIR